MALGVVMFDVSGDRLASGGVVFKAVLPGAFLFEGADELTEERQSGPQVERSERTARLLRRAGGVVWPRFARPSASVQWRSHGVRLHDPISARVSEC